MIISRLLIPILVRLMQVRLMVFDIKLPHIKMPGCRVSQIIRTQGESVQIGFQVEIMGNGHTTYTLDISYF